MYTEREPIDDVEEAWMASADSIELLERICKAWDVRHMKRLHEKNSNPFFVEALKKATDEDLYMSAEVGEWSDVLISEVDCVLSFYRLLVDFYEADPDTKVELATVGKRVMMLGYGMEQFISGFRKLLREIYEDQEYMADSFKRLRDYQ
jgi:ADP-dependent phosphofructokinase/glucokinase